MTGSTHPTEAAQHAQERLHASTVRRSVCAKNVPPVNRDRCAPSRPITPSADSGNAVDQRRQPASPKALATPQLVDPPPIGRALVPPGSGPIDLRLKQLAAFNSQCLKSAWLPWCLGGYLHIVSFIYLATTMLPRSPSDPPFVLTMVMPEEAAEARPITIVKPEDEPTEETATVPETREETDEAEVDDEPIPPFEPPAEPLAPDSADGAARPVPVNLTPSRPAERSESPSIDSTDSTPVNNAAPTVPRHAIVNGNFSIWAEPARPRPGEPYAVFIQIRLPERIKRYPRNDLQGMLIGSDGYRKLIGGPRRGYLPMVNHTVKIVVHVVGAGRPELDTLVLRSRMLGEEKVIKLDYLVSTWDTSWEATK